MLASALPSPVRATPASNAVFLNVPSRWLIQSRFGFVSLATKMSIQPSLLKSAVDTPRAGPNEPPSRALAVTSTNVPFRSLWYSRPGCDV